MLTRWFSNHLAESRAKCLRIRNKWYPQAEWPGELYLSEIRARPASVLLELGCGRRADMLVRAADRFRLKIGIDPECQYRENLGPSVLLMSADAARLPLGDQTVDVIAMRNLTEHLADPEAAFRECKRVLRPAGQLVIYSVNAFFPPIVLSRICPHRVRVILNRLASGTADQDTFPVFYRANSARALRKLARAVGLRVVELRYLSHHPIYLLFSPLLYTIGVAIERIKRRFEILAWSRHMIAIVLEKPE